MLVGIGIGGCFVLIFGIIGAALLIKHFRAKKKAEESQKWSSAAGRITESYVRREDSTDSDGYPTTSYYPEVQFTYEFLGSEYAGNKIAFGGSMGGGQKKAQESLAQYPVGKDVIVYYDPNNPGDAVLERRVSGNVFLIVGIVFLVISVCVGCVGGVIAVANLVP